MRYSRLFIYAAFSYFLLLNSGAQSSDRCGEFIVSNGISILVFTQVNTHYRICVTPSKSKNASYSLVNIYITKDVNTIPDAVSLLLIDDSVDSNGISNGNTNCSTVAVGSGNFVIVSNADQTTKKSSNYSSDSKESSSAYLPGSYCNVRLEPDW